MKKLIIILIFCLSGCFYEQEVEKESDCEKALMLSNLDINYRHSNIKDSITVAIVGDSRGDFGGNWYGINHTTYNFSLRGTTSARILNQLDLIKAVNPNYIVIFTGVNDNICIDPFQFQENINIIMESLKNYNVILVSSISPCGVNSTVYQIYDSILKEYSGYINFSLECSDTTDGVHYTESGYKKISDVINNIINK